MFIRHQQARAVLKPSRRTFVKGLAIGGAAASVGLVRSPVWAQARQRQESTVQAGPHYDLVIADN